MDVRQIEYFVLAAKAGSFSAAAKSAFVTQQTLSASVASLEGEVKTPLFHRRRQGIELTDFGARFLPKCERVLEAVREAEGFALQWHESTRHTATFSYATASLRESGPGFTLATLRGFRASYDDADLRLFELTSDACLKALERGTVDMALVAGRPDSAVFEFTPRYAPVPFSLEAAQEFVRSGQGVDFSPAHNAERPHEGIAYRPLASEDDFTLTLGLATKLGVPEKPLVAALKEAIVQAVSA